MFKYLSLPILCVVTICGGSVITVQNFPNSLGLHSKSLDQWGPHIMDFLDIIELDKVMMVALQYIDDPQVVRFAIFVTSPQFREMIHEFESMDEFKEAFSFLSSKGYDVELLIDVVNSFLDLPPFEKPAVIKKIGSGLSALFQDIIEALPLEDMKELFESKLETSPEVAQLFETINSEEFITIMRKMAKNPKFMEFKTIFESYGFDFGFLCSLAKEIFGDYYQGIFCE